MPTKGDANLLQVLELKNETVIPGILTAGMKELHQALRPPKIKKDSEKKLCMQRTLNWENDRAPLDC